MNPSPQLRTSMMYGTISGLASFLVFIIIYVIGKNPLGPASWFAFWIPILFVTLGIQHHRDKDLGGFISYGRGLGTGTFIAFFIALLFSVLAYAFLTFIGHDVLEMHKNDMMEGLDKAKQYVGESIYDKGVEEVEKLTLEKISLSEFQNKFIGGVILSLIIAAFLRRKQSIFEKPADE